VQFGTVEQLSQVFPISEFLERIKSFLMITGDFVNQKFPVKIVREIMTRKGEKLESTSSGTAETVSTGPEEGSSAVRISPRKLPSSFAKTPNSKQDRLENIASHKRLVKAIKIPQDDNSFSSVDNFNLISEVVDLTSTRNTTAAVATSTEELNDILYLTKVDVGKLESIFFNYQSLSFHRSK